MISEHDFVGYAYQYTHETLREKAARFHASASHVRLLKECLGAILDHDLPVPAAFRKVVHNAASHRERARAKFLLYRYGSGED